MTNHFTTPEFYTETLKPFGIEVAADFKHYGNEIVRVLPNGLGVGLNRGTIHDGSATDKMKPAYLLSQVLGWLPKRFTIGNLNCEMSCVTNKGKVFLSYYGKNEDATHEKCTSSMDIEWYVTQGLTEGWLTKEIIEQQGLTKREYFAAMALQGLCAGGQSHFQPEMYAEYAVKYADAMIVELNKLTNP